MLPVPNSYQYFPLPPFLIIQYLRFRFPKNSSKIHLLDLKKKNPFIWYASYIFSYYSKPQKCVAFPLNLCSFYFNIATLVLLSSIVRTQFFSSICLLSSYLVVKLSTRLLSLSRSLSLSVSLIAFLSLSTPRTLPLPYSPLIYISISLFCYPHLMFVLHLFQSLYFFHLPSFRAAFFYCHIDIWFSHRIFHFTAQTPNVTITKPPFFSVRLNAKTIRMKDAYTIHTKINRWLQYNGVHNKGILPELRLNISAFCQLCICICFFRYAIA